MGTKAKPKAAQKVRKFQVDAEVRVYCTRTVEALDEVDALDQCRGINANEWIENFTVTGDCVEDVEVFEVRKNL